MEEQKPLPKTPDGIDWNDESSTGTRRHVDRDVSRYASDFVRMTRFTFQPVFISSSLSFANGLVARVDMRIWISANG